MTFLVIHISDLQLETVWDIRRPQSHEHSPLRGFILMPTRWKHNSKYPHFGQAIIQTIYLHSFLSSPLRRGQKLFLLISHKWHNPAQLIIIQALWLSWLIGMRAHWSICLRISFEAATPPIPQRLELCEIDTAVWTLRIDLGLWLRAPVAGSLKTFWDQQCQSWK